MGLLGGSNNLIIKMLYSSNKRNTLPAHRLCSRSYLQAVGDKVTRNGRQIVI
jgi:hypothetical protein